KFTLGQVNYLVQKVNLIYRQCQPKCDLTVLVGESARGLVASSLYSSNHQLRCVITGRQSLARSSAAVPSVTFIRPVLDGCVHFEGIFVPRSPADLASLSTKPSKCN